MACFHSTASDASPDYPDGVSLVRDGAPVVATRTFSKAYGLGGLRAGYGVAAPEVIQALLVVREAFCFIRDEVVVAKDSALVTTSGIASDPMSSNTMALGSGTAPTAARGPAS